MFFFFPRIPLLLISFLELLFETLLIFLILFSTLFLLRRLFSNRGLRMNHTYYNFSSGRPIYSNQINPSYNKQYIPIQHETFISQEEKYRDINQMVTNRRSPHDAQENIRNFNGASNVYDGRNSHHGTFYPSQTHSLSTVITNQYTPSNPYSIKNNNRGFSANRSPERNPTYNNEENLHYTNRTSAKQEFPASSYSKYEYEPKPAINSYKYSNSVLESEKNYLYNAHENSFQRPFKETIMLRPIKPKGLRNLGNSCYR